MRLIEHRAELAARFVVRQPGPQRDLWPRVRAVESKNLRPGMARGFGGILKMFCLLPYLRPTANGRLRQYILPTTVCAIRYLVIILSFLQIRIQCVAGASKVSRRHFHVLDPIEKAPAVACRGF
jgi:hypothetical protein